MNLTDKARRGSQEAMEALFDMTKNDVAYLCRLLLGDNQASGVAVPRIYSTAACGSRCSPGASPPRRTLPRPPW